MNECVGGKDVFQCEKCGLESDRDFHAARNILLKWLSESRFPTMTHVGEKSLVEATL
jgi:transposase